MTKKEYHREYHKAYYQQNKEKIDEKNKRWHKNNPKKSVEYVLKSRAKNKERFDEYQKKYERETSGIFRRYKYSAKRRNLTFGLTKEQFKSVLSGDCHYCGDKDGRGIDRTNNDIGYEDGNVVPCCKTCNMMKKVMTEDEFKSQIKAIYKHLF